MDERQQQIKEGAGLDESRLNQDFIDLLRKWSTPVLLVGAIVAFSYFGYQRWQQYRISGVDMAFSVYEEVRTSGSPLPSQFAAVSAEYGDVRSLGLMADLDAADTCMLAVRRGVMPGLAVLSDGAIVYPTGEVPEEDVKTLVDEADRESFLSQAESLYRSVIERTEDDEGKRIFAVGGAFGLVAVAEARGELDNARGLLERASALAEEAGFDAHVMIARTRLDSLAELAYPPLLYSADDLPTLHPPEPETPDEPADADPAADPADAPDQGEPVEPPPADPGEATGEGGESGESDPAKPGGDPPPPA